jgi:hypothetical protein
MNFNFFLNSWDGRRPAFLMDKLPLGKRTYAMEEEDKPTI